MGQGRPVALITGISGQDGAYLAELLQARGYDVHGTVSPSTAARTDDAREPLPGSPTDADAVTLPPPPTRHAVDLTDSDRLPRLLEELTPDEVYHLAAQTDVRLSFDLPLYTANVIALGTLRLLEAIRQTQERTGRRIKLCQAASSEIFGTPSTFPQTETTACRPNTPYGCAKAFAYWQTINYREAHGLFACNAILYNHESPRRSPRFVVRKVTQGAARIKLGLQRTLRLGNLDARRDWGSAEEYVEALRRMLQCETADDYIVATGRTHSIRDLLDVAFAHVGLAWADHVEVSAAEVRPADAVLLCGDASRAQERLGWKAQEPFADLVRRMVDHDLMLAQAESGRPTPAGRRKRVG